MAIEYGADTRGGKWYYTNNKFGTEWFDNVNNSKGWTVDFNLRVVDIQNNDILLDEDIKARGVGIYVNDGSRQEEINFLKQEISFVNADKNITYDTTGEIDYRLIGKKDNMKLFARASGEATHSEIANINFSERATKNGNGLKPAVFEDVSGNIHAAWHDDGGGVGNIYYSKYTSGIWSDPEMIVNNDSGNQFVDIVVDINEDVYVAYESKSDDGSLIGLVFKNSVGWSEPYYTGVGPGYCKNIKLTFDSRFNVCAVWSDERYVHPQIYLNVFSKEDVSWGVEIKLSNDEYGAYRPSISSYLDEIFISWTGKSSDDSSVIKIIKYNSITSIFGIEVQVNNISGNSDYSDVLVNVSGSVFIVWSDNILGDYNLYAKILSLSLATIYDVSTIIDGYGAARYPSLSEQISTGNIYITWQDYKSDFDRTTPITDPSDIHLRLTQDPLNSALYVALYQNGGFESSGKGSFDVNILFEDNRNTYFPTTPAFFGGELPILYESYSVDEYGFLTDDEFLSQIRCAFYTLVRAESTYIPNYGINNDEEYGLDRDMLLNERLSTKEIRFGDFSNVMNAHYIFKNFKYYTKDAVEPFSIIDINSSKSSVGNLSSFDAVINNYGDVWMAGPSGVNFYVDRQNRVVTVGEDNELPGFITNAGEREDDDLALKNVKVIAFDTYNNMYLGNNNSIRYSTNHINGFKFLESLNNVTAMVFDKENNLFVGTTAGILFYSVDYVDGEPSLTPITYGNTPTGVYVTSLKVDDNNCVWICTNSNGLYRFYKGIFFNFKMEDGLSSNIVNDIAIRNTAIRYVATSSGINKMIGFSFDADDIISDNDNIWNNNVKSILWKEPNLIIAGTLSRINQILVDDINEEYSTLVFEPSSSVISNDDFQVYYITGEDATEISNNETLEVYINGTLVSHGYDIGFDRITDPINQRRIIRFKTPLSHNDIVDIVIRKDIFQLSTFSKTSLEKSDLGSSYVKIKDFVVDTTDATNPKLYAITDGDEKEVKINDSSSLLPFDKIHLDTTPPDFTDVEGAGINIADQVDRDIVKIEIVGATDGDEGSGVDTMIISNNSDFVDSRGNDLSPVLFSTPVNHSLGNTLEDITIPLSFSSGSGSVITYISDVNGLYAAVSQPAVVYKYNWGTLAWDEVYSYGDDYFVDFIIKYNDKLIVSVGHSSQVAKLYIYNIVDGNANSVSDGLLNVSESRAYSNYELNGKLYVGTGVGSGEGSATGAGDSGNLYVYYDGTTQIASSGLVRVVSGIDENIYSLTNASGNNLLAGTGGSGFIYEIDVENEAAFIVHNNNESIVSMTYMNFGTEGFVFAGGSSMGVIRKSSTTNSSYDVSFRTIPSNISALKVFQETVNNVVIDRLYAAVGNVVYYLSENGSWVWRYTHTESINDMTFNESQNDLYLVSNSNVAKISPLVEEKVVYLKLIDRAGNESVIDTTLSIGDNKFIDSIDISSLVDFVNENKIFELNELGETVYTLRGDNKFYSANKIEQEKGEYISEIFNGTNDLVKWDNISWVATELFDTSVLLYVRTNSSDNDILATDWIGPYTTSDSAGVDLSSFSGQYLQFKVELISNVKGRSPSFHRASIRTVTSEAIHFFTTNFTMPSRVQKGIITSQKIVPVSADIIFGMNTTNSVDWADYQEVDENRLFNVNQSGTNLRVGIKLISPSRSLIESTGFDEYGPYNSELFVNTMAFTFENTTASVNDYHFRVSLYTDVGLTNGVFSAYSSDSSDGFSVDGAAIPAGGISIDSQSTVDVLFAVPGSANITCNVFYYVKIEYIYDSEFIIFDDNNTFVSGCTASFVDNLDFDFTNNESTANNYHFRVRFYNDLERTSVHLTEFSGNDRTGWFIDDIQFQESGASVAPGATSSIVFRPDSDDFDVNKIYYLSIEAHDGSNYVFEDNSYTFQLRDVQTTESCGGYADVPIVKNFGVMVELEDNEFVTLNI